MSYGKNSMHAFRTSIRILPYSQYSLLYGLIKLSFACSTSKSISCLNFQVLIGSALSRAHPSCSFSLAPSSLVGCSRISLISLVKLLIGNFYVLSFNYCLKNQSGLDVSSLLPDASAPISFSGVMPVNCMYWSMFKPWLCRRRA